MTRRLASVATIMVIAAILVLPASAYEFRLSADFYWNYYAEYQMGNKGFFGPYDVDNSGMFAANQNFWAGVNRLPGVYSGASANRRTQYMDFSPEFRLNKAVQVRGTYRVGGWSTDFQQELTRLVPGTALPDVIHPEYDSSQFIGTNASFSPGYWKTLYLSAETPMGTLVVGKRPNLLGLGTLLGGADNTTGETVALRAPYGPFGISLAFYASRPLTDVQPPALRYDAVNKRSPDAAVIVTYQAGNLDTGAFYDYAHWVLGPESQGGATPADRQTAHDRFIPRNLTVSAGLVYLKYFNGRFFFNAEFEFFYSQVNSQRNAANTDYAGNPPFVANTPGLGSVFRPKYTEMERYYIETGVVAGPAKATLMVARIPGLDRRHGVLNDRQPNALWVGPENHPRPLLILHPEFSNTGFFNPYTYLTVFSYGGGLGIVNTNGDGQLVDANAFGARLDYALAANLNLWGSIFYAERTSHGYGWGYIAPTGNGRVAFAPAGDVATDPAPAIPDRSLGYEFGGGLDWALLEGLRLNTRVAYWLPGKWFNYACRSRENSGWDNPTSLNNWGIQPNRTIDPVLGLQIQLVGSF